MTQPCFPAKHDTHGAVPAARRTASSGSGRTGLLALPSGVPLPPVLSVSGGLPHFRSPRAAPRPPRPPAPQQACLPLPPTHLPLPPRRPPSSRRAGPVSATPAAAAAAPPAQVSLRVSWARLGPCLTPPVSLGATLLLGDGRSCWFLGCLWSPPTAPAPGAFRVGLLPALAGRVSVATETGHTCAHWTAALLSCGRSTPDMRPFGGGETAFFSCYFCLLQLTLRVTVGARCSCETFT